MELIASNSKQQIFNSATDVAVWFLLSVLDFQLKLPNAMVSIILPNKDTRHFNPLDLFLTVFLKCW